MNRCTVTPVAAQLLHAGFERHQAMHHNHPYAMRERATRSRRDDQTMSHFRAAVLEDAQRFIEASYRRAIVREAEASAPQANTRSTKTSSSTSTSASMKGTFL